MSGACPRTYWALLVPNFAYKRGILYFLANVSSIAMFVGRVCI